MPVTMLGDVMGTMYRLLIVSVYIHMVKTLTLIGLRDLALVQEYNCNCLTPLDLAFVHIQCMPYSHLILHVT